MKSSPIPKSQSKSLKKQLRAGGSAYEKSKSVQKKSIAPFYMLSNLAGSLENGIHSAVNQPQNGQNQKTIKMKHEREREQRKKPAIAPAHHKRVKNFIGSKLQKRLESYNLFLALARQTLLAPVCKYPGEQRNYTVFVGKGNNSKLIKKLFHSRHWWTVTNDPKAPNINLIWTQWSKKSIFSQLQQAQVGGQSTGKIICQSEEKKSISMNQYNLLLKNKQRDLCKPSFVETQNDVRHYLTSCKQSRKRKTITRTCNHVQGHETITDKKNLFYSLHSYCKQRNQNVFDILPLTFHVTGSEQEFQKIQEVEKKFGQDKRLMWIAKPGEKSNRGNGIRVFKKVCQIREYMEKQSTKYPDRTYIIQQYIYPALFHRRKFDIRCFVLLIASPHISAYFYNDGYIRTSSKEFKDKKFDDKLMHLTNDAIQKKGSDYGKYEKGNKVTLDEYQAFVDMFEKKEVNFKKDILPKLKVMAAKSIAAGSKTFNESKRSFSFQLLGYDFMLDEDYRPWLIEVNTNPCIETGCPVLANFIPAAVNNAIKLAVDSVFKPPKVNDWHLQEVITFPQKILEPNRYQLIFQQSHS